MGDNVPVCHGATYITSATFFHCPTTTPPRRYYAHGRRRRRPPSQSLIWATAEEGKGRRDGEEDRERGDRRDAYKSRKKFRATSGGHGGVNAPFKQLRDQELSGPRRLRNKSNVEPTRDLQNRLTIANAGFVESCFSRYSFWNPPAPTLA